MTKTFSVTKPISIFPATKTNGQPTRRLVISVQPSELSEMPAELFAVKISQSPKPERAGKLVFKYFSFKPSDSTPWSDMASTNFNIATPVEEIKQAVVNALGTSNAKVQFTVNMPGQFANIETSDGHYSIYDFNESADGNLGYYFKGGTVVTVTFTEATHNGNPYYRLSLNAETLAPDEIFARSGKGKRFGEEADAPAQQVYKGDDADAGVLPW